jgi:hypothetical protein
METINTNSYYSLNNIDNYKSTINDNSSEIINKYFLLINEYLSFIIENISFKNSVYTKFTVERGFETITHVFTLLLYFSRNLDLAYYHGQKSFYFYVEFIGQISEDKHSFLQLNSRDASMFVYKKTIFDMNNDARKNICPMINSDNQKLEILNLNIIILKHILCFVLEKDYKNVKKIFVICDELLKIKVNKSECSVIDVFINLLKQDIQSEKYIEIIQLFINKFFKMKPEKRYNVTKEKIKNKFTEQNFNNKLNETAPQFIKWLLS